MSQLMLPDLLVSVEWLKEHLDDPQLVVFDASLRHREDRVDVRMQPFNH